MIGGLLRDDVDDPQHGLRAVEHRARAQGPPRCGRRSRSGYRAGRRAAALLVHDHAVEHDQHVAVRVPRYGDAARADLRDIDMRSCAKTPAAEEGERVGEAPYAGRSSSAPVITDDMSRRVALALRGRRGAGHDVLFEDLEGASRTSSAPRLPRGGESGHAIDAAQSSARRVVGTSTDSAASLRMGAGKSMCWARACARLMLMRGLP